MIESNYKRITDAWDTLKGEKSRATYDENLRVKKTKHRNGRQLVETAVIIGGTAIANGLIGIAAEELLSNHRNDATFISRGACRWEDRGWLICKGQCESEEWDAYKYHTGFLMDGSIGGYLTTDLPDKNFEDYRVAKRRILMNTPAHPSMKKSLLQMPDGYANATQIYTQQPLLPTLASHERTEYFLMTGGQHQFAYNPELEQLRALIGTVCGSSEEKYLLLKKRDELMCKARIKNTDVSVMRVVRGTCPDMCPEKERYRRETQKNLTQYECDPSGRIVPAGLSKTTADLLPIRKNHYLMSFDLRTLQAYSVKRSRPCEMVRFLVEQNKVYSQEISQQMLCDRNAVDLVEKCIRLHTFASFWMANLDVSDFDPKMNRENLSKCLQTLRHMYEDLASQGVVSPNEAEFRGYDMLLNLCDSNVHSYVCAYRNEVCMSPQVQLALVLAASLQGNNYVKFFRILKTMPTFCRYAFAISICLWFGLQRWRPSARPTSCFLWTNGADSLELANGKLAFEGKMPQPESLTLRCYAMASVLQQYFRIQSIPLMKMVVTFVILSTISQAMTGWEELFNGVVRQILSQ
uniref:SAC3/GANP/THP3 conserved domain-containing protein n=1 Tax=Ditylenchus dipsaci TaxID=166011 RepID=A0A915EKG1_9BILA